MIMCFHFKTHIRFFIKTNHSGVIMKNRNAPGFGQISRGFGNRRLQQIIDHPYFFPAALLELIPDFTSKRFVMAMLTPHLGNRFQFAVGRVTPESQKIFLDGPHFLPVQKQLAVGAELQQLSAGGRKNRDRVNLCRERWNRRGVPVRKLRGLNGMLNQFIGQDFLDNQSDLALRQAPV